MIKNSDFFYSKAAEFQSKRKEVIDTYESTLEKLEKAKGSQLYTEEAEKAVNTRDTSLEALKNEYGDYFRISLDAMREANGKRGINAPTADQLSIVQALKMRDRVSQNELDRAANSCKDNALAISVINEIARKNGFIHSYHTESGEMSVEDADKIIDNLKAALPDFLTFDTSKAARIVADHHARLYGKTNDERPLAKRPLFEDKASCFNTLLPFGMSAEAYKGFIAAVDSE